MRCGVARRRAKTDRQDALWLRELLAEGRLPEAWIAPEHIRQWRSRLHLRKALIDERTQWLLRVRSVLYHHGLSAGAPGEISSPKGREFLNGLGLPGDARETRECDRGWLWAGSVVAGLTALGGRGMVEPDLGCAWGRRSVR